MRTKTVGYSESQEIFNQHTGLKVWRKSWHEMEVGEGDNDMEAHKICQQKVNEAFREMNDQYVHGNPILRGTVDHTSIPPQPIPSIDRAAIERLEILIDNAETTDELATYWDQAIEYHLKGSYERKLYELNRQQIQ